MGSEARRLVELILSMVLETSVQLFDSAQLQIWLKVGIIGHLGEMKLKFGRLFVRGTPKTFSRGVYGECLGSIGVNLAENGKTPQT